MFRKHKYIVPIVIWCVFIGANGFYYLHHYWRTLRLRVHAENYYTSDTVWSPEESEWHDDILLYTLFKGKTVYINPDSWYMKYVKAFADNVTTDENIDAMLNAEMKERDNYTRMNHMGIISHSTLFDEEILDILASSEEGLSLFIDGESVYDSSSIIFLHDDSGNIYLRGADDEE